MKLKKNAVLSFLLPAVIVLIAYISIGVHPFGNKSTMIIDSYHQYVPFFSELHDKIWKGESLLYSWHGSLGYNFLAVTAYYLASPLNILIAIFPADKMINAFETLILLKIALASLAAYFLLRKRTGKDDLMIVLFAGFYALGGFTLAYNWNVMWLDSLYLLPLVVMGADRLIDEGNGIMYTVMLGLAVICNYYMAIMICIFMVLYFFVAYFSKKRESAATFFKRGFLYAFCSIIGGGLGSFYLLPTYYTLMNSSTGSAPSKFKFYRSFFDMFKQMFSFVEPTQLEGAPNLYCGILVAMLSLVFLTSKKILVRKKIAYGLCTAFVFVSFNINYLDYVWHGFHFPNNLPGRFSFIYILLMVMMAADAYADLEFLHMRWMLLPFSAELILLGLTLIFAKEDMENYTIGISIGFIVLYILLFFCYKKDFYLKIRKFKIRPSQIITLLLTLELAANTIYALNMNGSTTYSLYMADKEDVAQIREEYESTAAFYRMELAQIRGRDDVVWQNLNGLSLFSSTADDRLEKLLGALGFYNAGNKYSYKGATPLTDAMLSIRYVISNSILDSSNLRLEEETDLKYVYENDTALALGYMVNESITDWNIIEGRPFNIQNEFVMNATDLEDPLFTPLYVPEPDTKNIEITSTEDNRWYYDRKGSDASLTYQLFFTSAQDVYIYFEASHCESLEVYVDGECESYSDEKGHIVHLGICDAAQVVTLNFVVSDSYNSGNVGLQMYAMDLDVMNSVYEELSDEQLIVSSYDSTHVNGEIKADQDGIMMLSIPYDEGWTILIDGQKAPLIQIGEALTGVRVSAGEHEVSMTYVPLGFKTGVFLSGICLLLLMIMLFVKNNLQKKGL